MIGMPSKDTVKIADTQGYVAETPERSSVMDDSDTQIFEYNLIREAHEKIRCRDMSAITDDAMVVEQETGVKIVLVEGSYKNLKITTPEDLDIAEIFFESIG